ncbi:hypothetical protein SLITO_v1c02400 [Spiroplasma litorale]|uniref:ABC transporter permease n=1 Tax=Spiroplasma litorale TaxID=216942 RepID=A0A0K1W1C8_9MOLU|nr:ABC transporter permease subunit [Spiroplasma litorale]AKX33897.1 hypothetical protein SLITO_v1c02400 [Spiroplasma litorale]
MSTLWLFLTIIPILMLITFFITLKFNGSFNYDQNLSGLELIKEKLSMKIKFDRILNMMFFGNLGYLLPIVFIVVTSGSVISGELEKRTMSNIINTNLTRRSILITKLACLVSLILIAVFAEWIITIILIYGINAQEFFDILKLGIKFLGLFLMLLLFSSIGFISSCYFNRSVHTLSIIGVIVIISLVLSIVATTDKTLEWMKYLSINTLFDYSNIDPNKLSSFLGQYMIMLFLSIGLYVSSYFIFTKKDLSL